MTGVRARVYLRDEEDAAVRAFAKEHGTSYSYVLRAGLRMLVGLPVAEWLRAALLATEPFEPPAP